MTEREALKLALKALEDRSSLMKWQIARDAAEEALAQPEQEPVALMVYRGELCYKSQEDDQSFGMWCPVTQDLPFPEGTKFYTTPPQPKEPEQRSVSEHLWPVAWCSQFEHSCVQPPRRKPLTDEQIDAAMPQPTEFRVVQLPWNGSDITILRAMARAIEAAHGIKE